MKIVTVQSRSRENVPMPVAALDLGRRRIGVAVSDAAAMGAHPLGIVERRALKHDLDAIAGMLRDRHVSSIIVGLPLNMDGTEGPAAISARKFAERVAEALHVTVEMFDERLTSFEARDRLADMPARKGVRKTALDALAAVVILEGWMQANPEKIPRS
jgi:putative holliday junction resolvase